MSGRSAGAPAAFVALALACATTPLRAGRVDRSAAGRPNLPRPADPDHRISKVTTVRGRGLPVSKGDRVRVRYTGKPPVTGVSPSLDGNDLAPSGGSLAFVLGAGEVIEGWDEGIVGMKVGEKRRLVIPAAMAYGRDGAAGQTTGEALVYEVELLASPGEGHED